MNYTLIFTIVITIIVLYLIYLIYKNWYAGIRVQSGIDNRYYLVRNISKEYNQKAADTLAALNLKTAKLINHLKSIDNGSFQKNIDLLVYRYKPEELMENILEIDTSFTIDKGRRMEICIDPRDNSKDPKIHDINILAYVKNHELAHCASITYGHTPEFKRNFQYILKKAIEIGVYEYVDYSRTPVEYCGMEIKNSVI